MHGNVSRLATTKRFLNCHSLASSSRTIAVAADRWPKGGSLRVRQETVQRQMDNPPTRARCFPRPGSGASANRRPLGQQKPEPRFVRLHSSSRCRGFDTNPRPPDYEAGELPLAYSAPMEVRRVGSAKCGVDSMLTALVVLRPRCPIAACLDVLFANAATTSTPRSKRGKAKCLLRCEEIGSKMLSIVQMVARKSDANLKELKKNARFCALCFQIRPERVHKACTPIFT